MTIIMLCVPYFCLCPNSLLDSTLIELRTTVTLFLILISEVPWMKTETKRL